MLKRLLIALAFAGLLSPAYSAGTLPGFSVSQQMDKFGKPLAGCTLYIIQAGTVSTPQTAYQDSALTIPVPGGSQLTCDAAGRISQFFLADGSVKIRLTDVNGVQQFTADGLLVVGPSGGGGGGASVDPTTILATGDIKTTYGTGPLSGFVRANGRTIGSATSGATERANADTQALFQYLWSADPNLVVSTGRGASAAADWAANKQIALPDFRGRSITYLDDMGNSASGRQANGALSGVYLTLGGAGGTDTKTLGIPNLPPYTPGGSVTSNFPALVAGNPPDTITPGGCCVGDGGTFSGATPQSIGGLPLPATFSGTPQGGTSTPLSIISPTIMMTAYIKL